ncbi:hypothetical protein [Acetanaerobacterium elongatum]|uniref:Uncharacterized protein n=1 Tax=Acetanaerobacterium elongatum TaxID=258515 RepID=A0A1G9Z2H0_9FIRM|nr:hypothetical protein [Acetanaerobacterium elongatum]SDN15125.1 hypothetical protein SAMN05192585_11257 [Acetanaerobacterium elongatum]
MNSAVELLAAARNDTCDIYRAIKNATGSITKNEEKLLCAGVRCRLSKTDVPSLSQSVAAASITAAYKVYFAPDQDVQAGDTLIVTRLGQTFECTAGEPFPYNLNKVVKVTVKKIT